MKFVMQLLICLLTGLGYTQNITVTYYVDHGVTDFHGQKIENEYDSSLEFLGNTSFYTPTSQVKEKEEQSLLFNEKDDDTGYVYTSNVWMTTENTYAERYIDYTKKAITSLIRKEKNYVIKEPLEPIRWKITTTKKIIGDYLCKKATAKVAGELVAAWFTEEIPVPAGPSVYNETSGINTAGTNTS